MAKKNDSTLMYRIAKRYYQDNLSQNEIAHLERISRSTVSRLLEKAKNSGIVTIDIKVPQDPDLDMLAEKLRTELHLDKVIVVPVSASKNNDETEEQILRDVVCLAATYLPDLIKDSNIVGVGWGRTVYNTASSLPIVKPDKNLLFVPLASNFTTRNRFLQTTTIVSRFSEKFCANEYYLNISSVKRYYEPRNKEEEANILQLQRYWDTLDAAIISVGMPQRVTDFYLFDEISPEAFLKIRYDSSACFELLGQIFFENGLYKSLSIEFDIVALDLECLKTIPNVICISTGIAKAAPIIHAARNGFIKTLIIDHLTAESILQMI